MLYTSMSVHACRCVWVQKGGPVQGGGNMGPCGHVYLHLQAQAHAGVWVQRHGRLWVCRGGHEGVDTCRQWACVIVDVTATVERGNCMEGGRGTQGVAWGGQKGVWVSVFMCLSGGSIGVWAGECRGDVDVRPAVIKKRKKNRHTMAAGTGALCKERKAIQKEEKKPLRQGVEGLVGIAEYQWPCIHEEVLHRVKYPQGTQKWTPEKKNPPTSEELRHHVITMSAYVRVLVPDDLYLSCIVVRKKIKRFYLVQAKK